MSAVVEGARIELLRNLAIYELYRRYRDDEEGAKAAAGVVDIRTGAVATAGLMPTHVPLWEQEWSNAPGEIEVAVKEARALGQIEYKPPVAHGPFTLGPYLRITTAGMAWLRKIGQMPSEPRPRERRAP